MAACCAGFGVVFSLRMWLPKTTQSPKGAQWPPRFSGQLSKAAGFFPAALFSIFRVGGRLLTEPLRAWRLFPQSATAYPFPAFQAFPTTAPRCYRGRAGAVVATAAPLPAFSASPPVPSKAATPRQPTTRATLRTQGQPGGLVSRGGLDSPKEEPAKWTPATTSPPDRFKLAPS